IVLRKLHQCWIDAICHMSGPHILAEDRFAAANGRRKTQLLFGVGRDHALDRPQILFGIGIEARDASAKESPATLHARNLYRTRNDFDKTFGHDVSKDIFLNSCAQARKKQPHAHAEQNSEGGEETLHSVTLEISKNQPMEIH